MSAADTARRAGALLARLSPIPPGWWSASGSMPSMRCVSGCILARRPGGSPPASSPPSNGPTPAAARDLTESRAARFAAKEAVMKALGTGLGGFALTEVEVRPWQAGAGRQ